MKEDLLKIINHYGVMPQLKYFQSEVFELNESIIDYQYVELYKNSPAEKAGKEHIAEEIADVVVMLKQFQYYYGIEDEQIEEVMRYKINRQLERLNNEKDNKNN